MNEYIHINPTPFLNACMRARATPRRTTRRDMRLRSASLCHECAERRDGDPNDGRWVLRIDTSIEPGSKDNHVSISTCGDTHRDMFYAIKGNCERCVNRYMGRSRHGISSMHHQHIALALALDAVALWCEDEEVHALDENEGWSRVEYFESLLNDRHARCVSYRPRVLDHDFDANKTEEQIPKEEQEEILFRLRPPPIGGSGMTLHCLTCRILYYMKYITTFISEMGELAHHDDYRVGTFEIQKDLLMECLRSILLAYRFDSEFKCCTRRELTGEMGYLNYWRFPREDDRYRGRINLWDKHQTERRLFEEKKNHCLRALCSCAMSLLTAIFRCKCVDALRLFKECAPLTFGMLLDDHPEELHRMHVQFIPLRERAPWSELLSSKLQLMERSDIKTFCEFEKKHGGLFGAVFNGFPRTDDFARVAYLNDLDVRKTMARLDEHKEGIEDGLYLDVSNILHRRFQEQGVDSSSGDR